MAKSDDENVMPPTGSAGRGSKPPVREVSPAELQRLDDLDRKLQGVERMVQDLANASSMQTTIENSLHEISTKLDPLRDLSAGIEKLDEDQLTALDHIQDELKRPATNLLQIVPRISAALDLSGLKGTRS